MTRAQFLPLCGLVPAVLLAGCVIKSLCGYEAPVWSLELSEEDFSETTTIPTEAFAAVSSETTTTTTTTSETTSLVITRDASDTYHVAESNTAAAIVLADVVEESAYQDGVYIGTGTGFRGAVTVAVTIQDGVIVSIEVLSSSDDEPYFTNATALLNQILQSQSTNVDTVTGATYSSVGLIEAVRDALSQAALSEQAIAENAAAVPQEIPITTTVSAVQTQAAHTIPIVLAEEDEQSFGNFPYEDGVYTGTGEGYRSDITVAVTIQNGYIISIEILSSGDDEPYFTNATALIDQMLSNQTIEVDAVSGATFSSGGILDAVADALENATPKVAATTATTATTAGVTTVSTATTTTTTLSGETSETASTTETCSPYMDGTYIGTALCEPDEWEDFETYTLSVTVVIENGEIVEICDAVGSGRDYIDDNEWYIQRAFNGTSKYIGVAQQILDTATTEDIDAVSGATCSSRSIVEAVEDALEQALQNGAES